MGAATNSNLSAVLFGKTRRAVLALLYGHPDESFYLRQVTRFARAGQGAVHRELVNLARVGILQSRVRERQTYYQANRECPVYAELQQLILKTAGVAEVLRAALAPLEHRVDVAFVYGSLARGEHRRGSDVDLLVIGRVSFAEVVSALQRAQETLGREINPTVYPLEEFRKKAGAGHHFLQSVLRESKIFLIGGESGLAAMAGQRLAPGAQEQPARNSGAARRSRP